MDKVAPLSGLDNIWHLMGSISEFDPLILSVFTCADTVPVEGALRGPPLSQALIPHAQSCVQ
jgi:hypothetical protein